MLFGLPFFGDIGNNGNTPHYPTLDDLLAELQFEISSAYIERIKNYKLPDEIKKVNRAFF